MNASQLAQIRKTLDLGAPLSMPCPVPGGLLHRLWRLRTTRGQFAVKQLDPEIMRRPGIAAVYRQSECIASAMAAHALPAVAARCRPHTSDPLLETGAAAFLVYAWIDGETLSPAPVAPDRAYQIGALLGRIHALRLTGHSPPEPDWPHVASHEWAELARRAAAAQLPWATEIAAAIPDLSRWSDLYRALAPTLRRSLVISHRDLDQKNVLWIDHDTPRLVDWEAAGLINPTLELAGTALAWSGQSVGAPSQATFAALIAGYHDAGGEQVVSGRDALLGGLGPRLDWLRFNMRRSLIMDAARAEEQAIGLRETPATLAAIRSLVTNLDLWSSWMDRV